MQVLPRTRFRRAHRPLALATGALLLATLAGCSLLEDRSERYVNAKEGEPIQLPAGADGSRLKQAMPIRDINTADSGKLYPSDIPSPPDMTSEILDENYVIQELDGQIWLLVNDVPGRLWPQALAYMNDRGLGVAEDNPQLGIMQSELANFSKQARALVGLGNDPSVSEPKVVLQLKMAPGIRRKTTEIQVRKLELNDAPEGLQSWPGKVALSDDRKAFQKKILSDLGDYLKGREESKSVSRAASGIASEPKVRLLTENDTPTAIRMDLDYGRAWAELDRALGEAGMQVVDLNRAEGWFYVDFRTEDERDPGWFSWFSDAEKPVHTHTVTVTRDGDAILVKATKKDRYTGPHTAEDLLTTLFESLY